MQTGVKKRLKSPQIYVLLPPCEVLSRLWKATVQASKKAVLDSTAVVSLPQLDFLITLDRLKNERNVGGLCN